MASSRILAIKINKTKQNKKDLHKVQEPTGVLLFIILLIINMQSHETCLICTPFHAPHLGGITTNSYWNFYWKILVVCDTHSVLTSKQGGTQWGSPWNLALHTHYFCLNLVWVFFSNWHNFAKTIHNDFLSYTAWSDGWTGWSYWYFQS